MLVSVNGCYLYQCYTKLFPHAGPSSYSNSGNLTPASASTSGSAFGQKKRTFGAHLDDDASSGFRVKSRRTTPSPQNTTITTPSGGDDFWADDASVIDLTGYVHYMAVTGVGSGPWDNS